MRCIIYKISSILLFSMMLSVSSFGQYYEAGIGMGQLAYWGDLNAPERDTNLKNSHLAAQVFMKYNFNGFFGLKTNLIYGNISGDDSRSSMEWQRTRNLSFKSSFAEVALVGEFFAFKYDAKDGDQMFSPYLSLGVSGFYFNPKALYNGQYYDLQPLGTEGQGISGNDSKYNLISGALIYGGGVKLKLSESLNLSFEAIAKKTFTDYIDDISGDYVDYSTLESNNGEMSAILANRANELNIADKDVQLSGQRGGKKVKDYVIAGMLTVSYNFIGRKKIRIFRRSSKVACPKM